MSDDFSVEIACIVRRKGTVWAETMTRSSQMTQTQAVIVQQLAVGAVQGVLSRMGQAAASAKDPEFAQQFGAMATAAGA